MISMVVDNISRRQFIFWGIVILNMLAFFSIGTASYLRGISEYNEESIKKSLSVGINNSGIISEVQLSKGATTEEINKLKQQLLELDEVSYIGNYWYAVGMGEYLLPLAEIENKYERIKGDEVDENETEYLNMDYSLLGFSELKVFQGDSFDEIEKLFDEKTRVIYLGYNLRKER